MRRIEEKKIGSGEERVYSIPILTDNYTYLLTWEKGALVIDPGESGPILSLLKEKELVLKYVLITHYHNDHTEGNEELKKATSCAIIGPEDSRIPLLDRFAVDGEELILGPFSIEVLATPGHTKPHVVYYLPALSLLFSGDLLFAGGCGKVFEGSMAEMWNSLERIKQLPEDTEIFYGHEYTEKNLEFACQIEKENVSLQRRLTKVKMLQKSDQSILPSTIKEEKETNPFLRTEDPALQQAIGMPGEDPIAIFTELRNRKDHF